MSDNTHPPARTHDGCETCFSRTKRYPLSSRRQALLEAKPFRPEVPTGGARRDRTDDLLLAKQALSQLSYGPAPGTSSEDEADGIFQPKEMVGLDRLERSTSPLSGVRSNHLSYRPERTRPITPRPIRKPLEPGGSDGLRPGPSVGLVREERETKTAGSRQRLDPVLKPCRPDCSKRSERDRRDAFL
jgi:hypothetical protein